MERKANEKDDKKKADKQVSVLGLLVLSVRPGAWEMEPL